MNPGSGRGVGVGTPEFSQCHNSRLTGADIKTHLGEKPVNQVLLTFDKMFTYVISLLLRSPVFPRTSGLVENGVQNDTSIKVSISYIYTILKG